MKEADLFIIGGGINGCGIARDAAGRGLSVILAEQNDLASATSSASTKLFHGGLRYLENYEFKLVREALIEREILLNNMPHISWPMRFLLPLHKNMRPSWLIRLGLLIYDHIGGRKMLAPTRSVDLQSPPFTNILKPLLARAFAYSDCWVQDARLVALNARDAHQRGASILTRTQVIQANCLPDDRWEIVVYNKKESNERIYHSKVLINAAGPWADDVIQCITKSANNKHTRLVRGSHIVIKKCYDHNYCYLLQGRDKRIVFAIPYENDFTLIGTTDEDHVGDPATATCSDAEIQYLCDRVNDYFTSPISPDDIVWHYSGVRPLFDDLNSHNTRSTAKTTTQSATKTTRDYVLRIDDHQAPLLNIFGGKITTYRRLAEKALEKLIPYFPEYPQIARKWTAHAPLPGGDFALGKRAALIADLVNDYAFIDTREAQRLISLYGTEARRWLGTATSRADLGQDFGNHLSEAEVKHLINTEFAMTAEDILWRRTKLGLYFSLAQTERLRAYLADKTATQERSS